MTYIPTEAAKQIRTELKMTLGLTSRQVSVRCPEGYGVEVTIKVPGIKVEDVDAIVSQHGGRQWDEVTQEFFGGWTAHTELDNEMVWTATKRASAWLATVSVGAEVEIPGLKVLRARVVHESATAWQVYYRDDGGEDEDLQRVCTGGRGWLYDTEASDAIARMLIEEDSVDAVSRPVKLDAVLNGDGLTFCLKGED